jgi:hypothetical protein
MAFTYDLTTNVGQVRLALGDTVSGSGVRPDGSNFTDAEIQYFLTQEADSVAGATAAACAALAVAWSNVANLTVGPRREDLGAVAEQYATRAAASREMTAGYVSLGFQEIFTATDDS